MTESELYDGYYLARRRLPDGRIACVSLLAMGTARLHVGQFMEVWFEQEY